MQEEVEELYESEKEHISQRESPPPLELRSSTCEESSESEIPLKLE